MTEPRRILIARSAIEDFWEPTWIRALRDDGHQAELFDTFAHLTKVAPRQGSSGKTLRSPDRLGWWQHRLLWGPRIDAANRALIERVCSEQPDIVLMYLGHHYRADTIQTLSSLSFVTLFHSDDPFGPRRHHPRYRLLHRALPWYQGGHFYRAHTTADALRDGIPRAETLLDAYRPWLDYPRPGSREREAVFIGHYEPGLRVDCISAAVRAGLPMHVHSLEPQWQRHLPREVAAVAGPRPGLYDDAYREKLSRAQISVCFLSSWNRDVYTRRVFEIPACGGFLFCQRSEFMQSLYEEDREAVYFESVEEFVDKLRFYLREDGARDAVAAAGRARLLRSGHDLHTRLRSWLATVERWRAEQRDARCAS